MGGRGGGGVGEKTPGSSPFRGWSRKWAGFIQVYSEKTMGLAPRKALDKARPRWRSFKTQTIRRELTRSLGELYQEALLLGRDASLPLNTRERWARLAAYIAQTINTLTKTYDQQRIEEALTRLEERVNQAMGTTT